MRQQYPQWDYIRELKPIRLAGISCQERLVRGEPWTFVHNDISGHHFRVNSLASKLLERFDGNSSIDALLLELDSALLELEKEALANTLLTLSQNGVISLSDEAEIGRQQLRQQQLSKRKNTNWANPLAIKIPLHDPDQWLTSFVRILEPILGRTLLLAVLGIILFGLVGSVLYWAEVTRELRYIAQAPQQWWLMLLVYPVIKCFHELAHAVTIKRFGGDVHEAGISLLVLMPVPYVDASDSWRIASRSRRMLVSAAGMLTEASLASLGFYIWLMVEPGLLSKLAFSVAVLASFSTLLFNANPLLKFDGYQIFQDAIDIPNLASRSARYLRYLGRRYLFKTSRAQSPVTGTGERKWLVAYGVSAAIYRWVITFGIALYLTKQFPMLGVCLALFAFYQLSIKPLHRFLRYLATDSELLGIRARAAYVSSVMALIIAFIIFVFPVPMNTRAEGIVDLAEQAQLFSPQSGELAELYVQPGAFVGVGAPVIRLDNPVLATQLKVEESELRKLELNYQAARISNSQLALTLREDIEKQTLTLTDLENRSAELTIRAAAAGVLSLQPGLNRLGQYVKAGESVGHIVNRDDLLIKAVIREKDIERVELGIKKVSIRLAERSWESIPGVLRHITPAGNNTLPSDVLAYNGYNGIAVASDEKHQMKTLDPVFHLEFALPKDVNATGIGGRAFITLTHQPESIGRRSLRSLRQLLLNQLAI